MSFNIQKNPNAAKQAALEAAKAKAKPKAEDGAIMKYVAPAEAKDRMRVVFDDSGSMSRHIEDAKNGVTEFFRNCAPNQTACSIHFLCTNNEESAILENLSTDLPSTALALKKIDLHLGGTPLFTKLNQVVDMELTNRIIAFTDGSPTDSLVSMTEQERWSKNFKQLDYYKRSADVVIEKAIAKKIAIDTVYFGSSTAEDEIALLKYFSERTGGNFLHFDPAKVQFAQAFKYLAPTYRLMLKSPSFRAEIEAGKKN